MTEFFFEINTVIGTQYYGCNCITGDDGFMQGDEIKVNEEKNRLQ